MSSDDGASVWYCPGCGSGIGSVVGGELRLSGFTVRTFGVNVAVSCGECGREKIWYPRVTVEDVARVFVRESERIRGSISRA